MVNLISVFFFGYLEGLFRRFEAANQTLMFEVCLVCLKQGTLRGNFCTPTLLVCEPNKNACDQGGEYVWQQEDGRNNKKRDGRVDIPKANGSSDSKFCKVVPPSADGCINNWRNVDLYCLWAPQEIPAAWQSSRASKTGCSGVLRIEGHNTSLEHASTTTTTAMARNASYTSVISLFME